MAGVTVSGVLWAVFQNNAGGAWDNAKKSFEAGVEINGEMTYKGSDAHKAAVTGDTVGVPPNMSMMRTSYMASHEDEHLEKILEVFAEVGKELGLIS